MRKSELTPIALDTETCLIGYPDQVNPDGICISLADGRSEPKVYKFTSAIHDGLKRYLSNQKYLLVGHNIAFDLHVIRKMFPDLEPLIWQKLELGLVSDTLLRERIYMIGTDGRSDAQPCSLAALSERWLGMTVEGKDEEDAWRYRYAELRDVPLSEWPAAAYDYAAKDAETTLNVWLAQEAVRKSSGSGSMNSEYLQVQASYALRQLTIDGIKTDQTKVGALSESLQSHMDEIEAVLMEHGILRPNGSRDMGAIREYLASKGVTDMTPTGNVSTSRDTLEKAVKENPGDVVLDNLLQYSAVQKGLNTFIPQMEFDRIHPEFNTIVSTLRTSCRASNYYKYKGESYGKRVIKRGNPTPSINFQQIPRDKRYRAVFIPDAEDEVFVCADYSNLELVCAAQTYKELFGFSDMLEVLNTGINLHDDMAAYNLGISIEEFKEGVKNGNKEYSALRQQGKTITLGIPGGRGWRAIAKERGIPDELAEGLFNRLRKRFRELGKFFGAHYGDPGWLGKKQSGFKVIDSDHIRTYAAEGPLGVWLNGKTYTQFANCISMQMPGALGAKIALFNLVKATRTEGHPLFGCSTKALIHDEFLVSVPRDKVKGLRKIICDIMIDSMHIITPDLRVSVEACIQEHWDKQSNGGWDEQEYSKPPVSLHSTCKT